MVALAARNSSVVARNTRQDPAFPPTRPPQRTDSRRPAASTRRGGLVLEPAPGAYAQVVVVRPTIWLELVERLLQLPDAEALRRQLRVAGVPTVLRACREWAASADRLTGRGVAVSHKTVAERIGYAESTVKRIMRFLSRLGLVVEVARGANRLTLEQIDEARQLGGEHQRKVASTRALTIPRSVDGTPLPTPTPINETSPVKKSMPRRASAHTAGAPRRSALNGVFDTADFQPRWTPEIQAFAAELVRIRPRLLWTPRKAPQRVVETTRDGTIVARSVGGRHIGQICDAVARLRLIERGWTVTQVLEIVDQTRATLRVDVDPAEQRDPLSWLVWLIRRAIGMDSLSPALEAQQRRELQLAESAARRHADAEARARAEAGHEASAEIIAAMWATRPSRAPRRPRRPQAPDQL